MIQKIKNQWFFLGLLCVFLVVMLEPTGLIAAAGIYIKTHRGPDILIFLIFLVSGLIIEITQIRDGIKDVKSTLAALVLIIVFSPVIAGFFSLFPLQTGIILGLFIVSVMPTTLSTGVVMTDKAGGNMAHALFVTIVSNAAAILTIPLILSFLVTLLDQDRTLSINQTAIMINLVILVLFPLLVGMGIRQALRSIQPGVKKRLQTLNQLMVICIVFMSLSGVKDFLAENTASIWIIVPLVASFHAALLILAYILIRIFRIPKGKFESVVFMGTQKTLPLSVMIQMTYFPEFGMALLVCVLHHMVHLMMDGYLSTKLK